MSKVSEESQVVIVRLHKILLERFDSVIDNLGLNRSEVIRMLMNEYVEKYNK
jgi:metal-responsive CopG/Arc/MetJ family transcriptional regulator